MAFFHLGDTQKSQGFLGSPAAASCGGRLYPQSANLDHPHLDRDATESSVMPSSRRLPVRMIPSDR
jgi:hypothetical protein